MLNDLKIKNPIIIIGCPRSGTSLLFRILSTSKYLWSLYRESNDIWSRFYEALDKSFKDEVLDASDLTQASRTFILNEFHKHTFNNYYLGYFIREYCLKQKSLSGLLKFVTNLNLYYKKSFLKEYRIVEKTPKNCFRISFIDKLFDGCKFIFLTRDGRSNISSLIEGWKIPNKYIRGQAVNIPLNIKGYSEHNGKHWKYVLPPQWENYTNKSLEEVCAFQWISSNKAAMEGLKSVEDNRKIVISYEELTNNTYDNVKKLCEYIDIPFSSAMKQISKDPPLVNYVTKPEKNKWEKNAHLIDNISSMIEPTMKELGYGSFSLS